MIPMAVIFFISALAETNRPPFDLPEAESELVAGYQVEYSSTPYLLFMIGEYANIVLMCALISDRCSSAAGRRRSRRRSPPSLEPDRWPASSASVVVRGKILFFFFLFAMVKAVVPRYRYDQLMRLGWKVFLPTSLAAVAPIAAWRVFGPVA